VSYFFGGSPKSVAGRGRVAVRRQRMLNQLANGRA
jgi:hypothetical protein